MNLQITQALIYALDLELIAKNAFLRRNLFQLSLSIQNCILHNNDQALQRNKLTYFQRAVFSLSISTSQYLVLKKQVCYFCCVKLPKFSDLVTARERQEFTRIQSPLPENTFHFLHMNLEVWLGTFRVRNHDNVIHLPAELASACDWTLGGGFNVGQNPHMSQG